MIPSGKTRTFVAPPPAPIAPLVVRVPHRVKTLFSHLPGVQVGSLLYFDLNGYAWYDGSSGLITHNRGRKGLRRTARGLEDGLGKTAL
ncbi:MAG: hypothetical protein RML14_01520 [Meiothermus sp.]|uniref:hypothetical protein n=1 Tax=Meiothermus sp. TaxID=1955249 RepID=UPI00298EF575|nr:hypothetical protein [Meiothermus sp.]MCS6783392.1 hypothetical protein [Gloeomargarita sp. SKYG98]MDW8480592.1 hypothetical protein [Meiothermus sp.]